MGLSYCYTFLGYAKNYAHNEQLGVIRKYFHEGQNASFLTVYPNMEGSPNHYTVQALSHLCRLGDKRNQHKNGIPAANCTVVNKVPLL